MTSLPKRIRDRILSWYSRHGRDLPWRQTGNPYFIWVSEIMLQQTRVDTALPYYQRFVSTFPDVKALARAPLQEVLKSWENLGYYARARHLHHAAKIVAGEMGGRVPDSWEALTRLPGVGSYTAGAILSIAYGQKVPAVDANAFRVISRWFAVEGALSRKEVDRSILRLAEELMPCDQPGRFNQAVMDFGALVCLPKKPSCSLCSVRDLCQCFRLGMQDRLPARKKRDPLLHRKMTAGIIADADGRILIVRRPGKGLLGGLWKFPGGENDPPETLEESLRRGVFNELGMCIEVQEAIGSIKHAYTHFRISLNAFRCVTKNGKPKSSGCDDRQWVAFKDLMNYPLSKAERKIIELL